MIPEHMGYMYPEKPNTHWLITYSIRPAVDSHREIPTYARKELIDVNPAFWIAAQDKKDPHFEYFLLYAFPLTGDEAAHYLGIP